MKPEDAILVLCQRMPEEYRSEIDRVLSHAAKHGPGEGEVITVFGSDRQLICEWRTRLFPASETTAYWLCSAKVVIHSARMAASLTMIPSEIIKQPLAILGAEIVSINAANGWEVCTPEDWPGPGISRTALDFHTTISEEMEEFKQTAKVRKIGTGLALIHSEVSEALEGLRHRDRANFEEELADVLIRVLDISHGLGIDMDAVVAAKLAKNRTRGFRHGGKAI